MVYSKAKTLPGVTGFYSRVKDFERLEQLIFDFCTSPVNMDHSNPEKLESFLWALLTLKVIVLHKTMDFCNLLERKDKERPVGSESNLLFFLSSLLANLVNIGVAMSSRHTSTSWKADNTTK